MSQHTHSITTGAGTGAAFVVVNPLLDGICNCSSETGNRPCFTLVGISFLAEPTSKSFSLLVSIIFSFCRNSPWVFLFSSKTPSMPP
uniref:Uncharacterized protein n=1 Tax=Arundo donax TaxID=35708 RepID=A0A0A9PFC6_ARUDO